jgi:type I site-specific restriction endonuclease
MLTAEQQARVVIDRLLTAAGWGVQDAKAADVHAGRSEASWNTHVPANGNRRLWF